MNLLQICYKAKSPFVAGLRQFSKKETKKVTKLLQKSIAFLNEWCYTNGSSKVAA